MIKNVKMIELSDISIRAYKKKTGIISLHLQSHLIIHTKKPSYFSRYLQHIELALIFKPTPALVFDEVSFTPSPKWDYEQGVEIRKFSASTVTPFLQLPSQIARLRLSYQYGVGHPMEDVEHYERICPIIRRY